MKVLALTGGIACGKSTVCRLLVECLPGLVVFDSDAVVRRLLGEDAEVCAEVVETFGEEAKALTGGLDRAFLRERVFSDGGKRGILEGILHPRVRQECLALIGQFRKTGAEWLVADVPLLFESGFDIGQDCVMVVASTRETQIQRLRARNGFDDALIESILAAQLPVQEKISLGDVVFWNEGPLALLQSQIKRFSQQLLMTTSPEAQAENETIAEPVPKVSVDVNELRRKPLSELQAMALAMPGKIQPGIPKSLLVQELLWFLSRDGVELVCEGIIEGAKENFCMLRDPDRSFKPGPDDIHMSMGLMKEHGLRIGQKVKVLLRAPRERGQYLTTEAILEVEGIPLADFQARKDFDKLTPLFPNERLNLEGAGEEFLGVRLIDLVAPLGKGQRGIIVAPPRGGKTILLKQIAKAVKNNDPDIELVVLLLDERPEEVTDFEETVGCQVFASTFDEAPRRHAQVAELVLERAKRLVEMGRDVVLLLDSLTRLARGYNSSMQGGPIGSGGVSPMALQKARKFFGTARNVEEGGSLTILATALVETESRLDDVVFEEFKGTGNMEVRLDRELAERRVFPAIHIPQSGTRNDDRLYHPDEFVKVVEIRRQLAQLPIGDALQTLLANLRSTKSNTELLLRGMR